MRVEHYVRHYPWVRRRLSARIFGWWVAQQGITAAVLAERLRVPFTRAEHLRAGRYDPRMAELAALDDDQLTSLFATLRRAIIAAGR